MGRVMPWELWASHCGKVGVALRHGAQVLVGQKEPLPHLCKGICGCLVLSHPVLDTSRTYTLTHYCKPPLQAVNKHFQGT